MKRENYIYLIVGIIALAIWILDFMSFYELGFLWYMIRGAYLGIGALIILICCIEVIPTTENSKARICDICGESITRDENSIHYHPKNGNTGIIDYCEKCKPKVIL